MSTNRKPSSKSDDNRISSDTIHPSILRQGRKSGQLNLSCRNIAQVPDSVWCINIDVVDSSGTGDGAFGQGDDRWWDQVDLNKLILASNILTELSEDIAQLPALSVLDVHDNHLTKLPDALGHLTNLQRLNLSHNQLCELPSTIGNLSNLSILHLQHNSFVELPEHISRLSSLEDLDVSHNKLTCLPKGLGFLSKLHKFNVANNHLQVLPHEVGCMLGLRVLDATHNQLHSIPEELGNLSHLQILYLRHNRLTHLPLLHACSQLKELHVGNNALLGLSVEQLQCLQSVSVLDLRDNRFAQILDEISLMTSLQRLDLSNNELLTLPNSLGLLPNLKYIVVDGNPMKGIRRDIIMRGTNELKKYLLSRIEETAGVTPVATAVRQSKGTSGIIGGTGNGLDPHAVNSTKVLDYSEKNVSCVPDDLWPLAVSSAVTTVNISKNCLTEWPSSLCELSKSLLYVHCQCNKISQIPASVGTLHKLMFLDLSTNYLTSLPPELGSLEHVREINIAFNRFIDLPACLATLKSLEILIANDNKIAVLDVASVNALSALATLDLRNNNIPHLPSELGLCTQLRSLQLEGNLFRQPRPAVLTKGTDFLLQYLRDRLPS